MLRWYEEGILYLMRAWMQKATKVIHGGLHHQHNDTNKINRNCEYIVQRRLCHWYHSLLSLQGERNIMKKTINDIEPSTQ